MVWLEWKKYYYLFIIINICNIISCLLQMLKKEKMNIETWNWLDLIWIWLGNGRIMWIRMIMIIENIQKNKIWIRFSYVTFL